MMELISTLGGLIASLGNTQSAAVLRERLALVNEQFALLKQHVEKLEKSNAQLVERCNAAEQQLARQAKVQDMKQHRGALFKPLAGGGYSETPICPHCGTTMWSMDAAFPYECSKCGHIADFTKGELRAVLLGLA